MVKAIVDPGICGLITEVMVSGDMMQAVINIESQCPHVQKLAAELQSAVPVKDAFGKFDSSKVYGLASQHCPHLACPVPMAIIKTMEIAGGLALPKDVAVRFSTE